MPPWIRQPVALLVLASAAGAGPFGGQTTWVGSLELPAGSRLDLSTGRVLSAGEAAEGLTIEVLPADVKAADPMRGRSSLRLGGELQIHIWGPGGARPAATRIAHPGTSTGSRLGSDLGPDSESDSGSNSGPSSRAPAEIGMEYVAAPSDAERSAPWAYLRVLDVAPESLRVEVGIAAGTTAAFVRDPLALTADAVPAGHQLQWSSSDEGPRTGPAHYSIERRVIDDDRSDDDWSKVSDGAGAAVDTSWIDLGTVEGTAFFDADAPRGRLVEYSVVRVEEGGESIDGVLGGIVRSVRTETPGEWPLEVQIGARIDLIAGVVVGPDERAHVEISRSAPGSLALRPLGGTRFALVAKAPRDPEASAWWLPPASDRRFLTSRTGIVRDASEIEFVLPGGIVGRLFARAGARDSWALRRQIGIDGGRLLPRPPEAPIAIDVARFTPAPSSGSRPSHTVAVMFPPLDTKVDVDPASVSLIVERELVYGREDWIVVAEFAPGERRIKLSDLFRRPNAGPLTGEAPIARLRARQRVVFGALSHASAPIEILAALDDSASRTALIEQAIAQLDAVEYQARVEAGAVLRKIGDQARPALEAVAVGDLGPRGVAARSVLESIERLDRSGAGTARSLRRRALELARALPPIRGHEIDDADAWLGAVPPSLVQGGPAARAHGLLVLIDRAERGVLRAGASGGDIGEDCRRAGVWSGAVAASDSDQGVRWLARFLAELGPRPSLASFEAEAPYFLMEPGSLRSRGTGSGTRAAAGEDGPSSDRLSLLLGSTWIDLPGSADALAWQLERRPELADLDLGPPLARLLHTLRAAGSVAPDWSRTADDRYFDYDARSAELVLRLVARAESNTKSDTERRALLDAAAAILPGVALDLAAWREVSDRRLASPSAAAVRRRTILLSEPDLALLDATLSDLAIDEYADGVDVLLPAGIYRNDGDEFGARLLEIRRSNVRLMAADPGSLVEIRAGIRVRRARNVVLEGVRIRNEVGSALMLIEGAHVVALRSRLSGAGNVLHVQDSDIEIIECVVDAADLAKPPQWAVRQLGMGRIFGRATCFDGGTLFLSDEGRMWLDRCVVNTGPRTLVQAQRAGHLVARETLFRGENQGLYNIEKGVLAAVVIDVLRDPLGRRPTKLRLSPRFFHLVGEGQRAPGAMKLPTEPLKPR